MKFTITEKTKKDQFISLFGLLKNCSNIINIMFNESDMYIQGMDKSHICLFDIRILASWFSTYEKKIGEITTICVDTHIIHNVLSMCQDNHTIMIHYDGSQEPDTVNIDLIINASTKTDFNKYFKIPLADLDSDILSVPDTEYEAEFSINAKKINEIMGQLLHFGDTINIKCSEEQIVLGADGVGGEMTVNIPIDDLTEYAISEGDIIDLSFSLQYIQKMCITHKLSTEIDFAISANYPMKIKYNLGNDSYVLFFIAPKIQE
jgi:proliferating cell nuclear antigen